MAVTIDIESPQLDALIAKLSAFPARLGETIKTAMNSVGPTVLGEITEQRFSGQGPFPVEQHRLGVRTGLLRTSLNYKPARSTSIGGELVEVTASMGSPVVYFPVHEFGFLGRQAVKSFSRRKPGSKKRARRTVATKAFERDVNYPARAPMQTGIRERIDQFTVAITGGLNELWATL